MVSDDIYIYIYSIYISPRDLGLVKDTLGWPSPMSSCVGPPWTSPRSSGVRMRLGTMFDFFSAAWNTRKTMMT